MDKNASPFHIGEQEVQTRLGVRDIEAWARQVVRDHLPQQHRDFHTSLPFLIVAARDAQGRPWVTLLEGEDGFVQSPDAWNLVITPYLAVGDALEHAFRKGADVGILGIELSARRRNRVNGSVASTTPDTFTFRVQQSFGNCPQYIRERAWRRTERTTVDNPIRGSSLSKTQQQWIESADTFFIGTGYRGEGDSPTFGMDASHRGGERGFVHVLSSTQIQFPDYAGNNHFNTIGNLLLDPRAGFLFVDFETGSLLQISGATSIDWESDELARFPGARRLVTLAIEEVVELPEAVGLRWDADAGAVRSLRVVAKVKESTDVTSFVFEARDGGPLANFEPGQHLPIELSIPGHKETVRRTYSLSSAPRDPRYRITVKREPEGLASTFLHDHVEPGAIVESRRPTGDFMMTCNICPLVLVSAGVGITPLLSILNAVAARDSIRAVWFVHGARDSQHHPLAEEVRRITASHPNFSVHVVYSNPLDGDRQDMDYDSIGRIDGSLLANLVQNTDAHYFLCGPTGFMASVQKDLELQGIPMDQIHVETFGPSG